MPIQPASVPHRRAMFVCALLLVSAGCEQRNASSPQSTVLGSAQALVDVNAPRAPVVTNPSIFEVDAVPPSDARASFFGPTAIALVRTYIAGVSDNDSDSFPRLVPFLTDTRNSTIRRVEVGEGSATVYAGAPGQEGSADGDGNQARFRRPRGLAASAEALFVADTLNHTIRRISLTTRKVTTVAGAVHVPGKVDGTCVEPCSSVRFNLPTGLAYAPDTRTLYLADTGNSKVRQLTWSGGGLTVSTLAPEVDFRRPEGLVYDEASRQLYVADTGNHVVRRIDVGSTSPAVAIVVGQLGVYGPTASAPHALAMPTSLAIAEGALFVSDPGSNTLQRVSLAGASQGGALPTTVIGGAPFRPFGPENPFRSPSGLAASFGRDLTATSNRFENTIAAHADQLFVTDQGRHVLLTVPKVAAAAATSPILRIVERGEGAAGPSGFAVVTGTTGRPGRIDGFPGNLQIGTIRSLACSGTALFVHGNGIYGIDPSTGIVRVISPLHLSSLATNIVASSTHVYLETTYGDVAINLETLSRKVLTAVAGSDDSQLVIDSMTVAGDMYFKVLKPDQVGTTLTFVPSILGTFPGSESMGLLPSTPRHLYYGYAGTPAGLYRAAVDGLAVELVAPHLPPPRTVFDDAFAYNIDASSGQLLRRTLPSALPGPLGPPQVVVPSSEFESGALVLENICLCAGTLYTSDVNGGLYGVNLAAAEAGSAGAVFRIQPRRSTATQ